MVGDVHLMQRDRKREREKEKAMAMAIGEAHSLKRGSDTVFQRVVGWVALFFVLSALLIIWAYRDSDRSWFQKPHTVQEFAGNSGSGSGSGSGLLNNVSIYLGKSAMHGGSATKSDSDKASTGGPETEAVLPGNASSATRGYEGRPETSVSAAIEEAEWSTRQQGGARCNLFRGNWVYEESYVLYPPGSCPYASIDFNCRKNGRMDSRYERWRWQPHDCDLPRFNASHMLEILRGKRLVYVGDSINRNQWESMLCLMRTIVPRDGGFLHVTDGGKYIQYVVKAYNCSIELSWAPFLVRQQRRYSTNGSAEVKETLSLDTIAEQSEQWKHADVLVFNTGHWWSHDEPYNGVDYFEEGGHVIPYMKGLAAFDKALKTWANWVDTHINPQKTKVFFRGYSPVHFHGKAWGKKVGGGCFNETEPIREMGEDNEQIYGERKRIQTVQEVVGRTKIGVQLLDITELSMYRKDAHASVYTSKYSTMPNKNDYSYADCSHWCLPGLPDVWNNLLYALLT